MTIEIRELIIQARVDERDPATVLPSRMASLPQQVEQDAMVALITRRVLEHLRDEREGWL